MKGRMKFGIVGGIALVFVFLLGVTLLPGTSSAAPPVVKTVPWVATNALIPHDTWSGKSIRLKGTCDSQGGNFQWTWDFGDGSPVATGTVTNKYVIEAQHTYTGTAGTIFTARLTVQNTGTGETGSKEYYVKIETQSLPVEVNVAIDEGLWALHKAQRRYTTSGVDLGDWQTWSTYYGLQATNINAFEVNGHLESGDPSNPYVETVARAMRRLFQLLTTYNIGIQTLGNPDTNGNGIGLTFYQSYQGYQTGMLLDAIVASGTPTAVATTGPANVIGRTYKDIANDIADWIFWAQYDSNSYGGWRYGSNEFPDNSACQWDAIGLIAAERVWGITIPQWVKDANKNWLIYSQNSAGYFGYTDSSYLPWGSMATTPSGLVQMVMDGLGRTSTSPNWAKAESWARNYWDGGTSYSPIRNHFLYALFSLTKAMLLHNPPIVMLKSTTPATYPDLDWYNAQVSNGDPSDGVARALINQQHADGSWNGSPPSAPDGNHYAFQTAWAIIMLNRTIFTGGAPVAVAKAIPVVAEAGQTITLDGSASFHQDPTKSIVSWQWDFNNDGVFDASGPVVTTSFPALGSYPVKLRVTDNASTPATAETIVTVQITVPPIAPTADANGPYVFCLNKTPFFLDGTKSVNPDNGQHDPGPYPGDFIKEYAWELDGDNDFNDAFGAQPDVTAFFTGKGAGNYVVQLRVKDNTAASFPVSGLPDLTSTASAFVSVKSATDPVCTTACVTNLAARAKLTKIQLTWTNLVGTDHYNVYRSTVSGGPYTFIGSTASTYSTYLDNGPLTLNTTYYYVVRPAQLNGNEICQSNEASAKPVVR